MVFPVVPRASSTLLLAVRNQVDNLSITTAGYKLLMLQRHSASKFMPNRYVFPGGASEKTDFSREWLELINNNNFPILKQPKNVAFYDKMNKQPENNLPPHIGFRICAIRETFEESGVLLVKPLKQQQHGSHNAQSFDEDMLDHWRKKVSKNASTFIEFCREIQCAPDIWSLYEWANWITPIFNTRVRFNTIFYIAFLEDEPDMCHDGEETIHSVWLDPVESLRLHYKNKFEIAPPQVFEMAKLCGIPDFEVLKETVMSLTGIQEFEGVATITKDGNNIMFLTPDVRYKEVRERALRHCEDLLKTNTKSTSRLPPLQLNETTEELFNNVKAGMQDSCLVLHYHDFHNKGIFCNYDKFKYNMPVPLSKADELWSKL